MTSKKCHIFAGTFIFENCCATPFPWNLLDLLVLLVNLPTFTDFSNISLKCHWHIQLNNDSCQGAMKDATYIAKKFQKNWMIDLDGRNTDVFFLDRASNVQKVGQILYHFRSENISYPSFSVIYQKWSQYKCDHWKFSFLMILSVDNSDMPLFWNLAICTMCLDQMPTMGLMCNSWLMHLQWTMVKGLVCWEGQEQSLSCDSMPSIAYSVKRRICWHYFQPLLYAKTLIATNFRDNSDMFPVLRALSYCDANKPAMDKIYYLCNKAENTFWVTVS